MTLTHSSFQNWYINKLLANSLTCTEIFNKYCELPKTVCVLSKLHNMNNIYSFFQGFCNEKNWCKERYGCKLSGRGKER